MLLKFEQVRMVRIHEMLNFLTRKKETKNKKTKQNKTKKKKKKTTCFINHV